MPGERADGWVLRRASGHLDVRRRMRASERTLLAAFGCVPLLAPYELLLRPRFDEVSLPLAFAVVISSGAVVLSLLFLAAAVAGLDERVTIDPRRRRIVHHTSSWVRRRPPRCVTFDAVVGLRHETGSWTDGPDAHAIVLRLETGPSIRIDGIEDLTTVQRWMAEIDAALRS